MSYQFSEKQVYVNECKIGYLAGGIAATDPILFLHGWGVGTDPYQEIINVLCQRYQVIAPALPGFGQSDGDKINWDYHKYATVLLAFLQKLEIKKVHLIGHSLGGGVGVALAALAPDVVSTLILVDSTGIPISVPQVLFQRIIEMTAQTPQIKFPQVQQVFQGFSYNLLFKTQNNIQMLWLALNKDLKPLLSQIECPCLVVWGANDMTTPLQVGQEFYRLIKNSNLVVVNEGYHEWSIFLVEKFTAIVFDFLNREISDKS